MSSLSGMNYSMPPLDVAYRLASPN